MAKRSSPKLECPSTKIDLDLNLVPVLEALILEESVSGAAGRLGITQSAVSHALRRLRKYFHDPLFIRSGNSMLPTPRAQALEPLVCETMDGLRRHMLPSTSFDSAESTHNFTINTTDIGEVVVAPAIVGGIRRLAPRCTLRFVSLGPAEAQVALEQGEVDISIGPQKIDSDCLYQQILLEQQLVCIVSRSHYKELSAFKNAEEFSDFPHVAISPFRRYEDAYERAFDGAGVRRRFVCTIRSFLAVPSLVAQSDMIATVPDCLLRGLVDLPNLAVVPLPVTLPRMPIWQLWHRRYHADAANRWLRQLIYSLFH